MRQQIATIEHGEQTSDSDLVAAAQFALPAFEHLYRRYVNDVYRFCLNRLRSEADSADATSQVFVKALSNIKSCNPESFRPWLFAIARNVVTDVWRSASPVANLDAAFDVSDPSAGPELAAIEADDRRSVLATLRHLTEDQRSIIELRLAGLTGGEIATLLGKSRNAVDQAQYRAIARIRTLLNSTAPIMEEPAK